MSWCPYRYTEEEMAAIREAKMEQVSDEQAEREVVAYVKARRDGRVQDQAEIIGRLNRAGICVDFVNNGVFWRRLGMKRVEVAENGYRVPYYRPAVDMHDCPLKKAEKAIQEGVAEQIGMQTAQHLTALDAALGKAVEDCQRVGGWTLRRCGAGGWDIFHETGLYLHIRDQTMAEMIHAVLSGDLLTALQRRDAVYEALPVAP